MAPNMSKRVRLEWLAAAFALLLLGLFLTFLSTFDRLQSLDLDALAALEQSRRKPWNHFFLELTALGSVTVLTWISLASLAFLLLARRWRGALQLFLASSGNTALTFLVKTLAARPRPPLEGQLTVAGGFSFPSGHSSSSAAIYLTLTLLLWPALPAGAPRWIFFANSVVLVAMIGFSRAYLGVHYPSDVAGGLCLGTAIALLLHTVPQLHRRRE